MEESDLRFFGVKEIFPGIFEFPFINTPETRKSFLEFQKECYREYDKSYKERRRREIEFDRKMARKHPLGFYVE